MTRRDLVLILAATALIAGLVLLATRDAAAARPSDDARIAALEARVAALEAFVWPSTAPSAAASPSSTPSPRPSASSAPSSPTSSGAPSPTPSATPSPEPSASPSATSSASPSGAADGYLLIDRADLLALPTSGASWTNVKAWADRAAGVPNLSDQDDQDDQVALAKALVFARTGTASYRTQVITMLRSAVGTEYPGDTLGIARNLGALVLAADLIGWRDATWMGWLRQLQTWENPDRDYTVRSIHDLRPNNWGGHAGASRIASDLYLGDMADLAKAWATFRGFMGDRSAYAGFVYGALDWQADPAKPVGINPAGATKSGTNVDGIIPDDARRGGSCCTLGTAGVDYTWESLQGWTLQAELLTRAGHDAFASSDRAVCRAVARINATGHPAAGDDRWQPWLTNPRCDRSDPATRATQPGKGFGFTDWLVGS